MLVKHSQDDASEQQLQEIAATCLYIGSKLEEIYPPSIEYFCNTPEEALTEDQLMELEREITMALKWEFTVPTLNNWLGVYTSDFDLFLQKKGLNEFC